jgi:hypothetical protein
MIIVVIRLSFYINLHALPNHLTIIQNLTYFDEDFNSEDSSEEIVKIIQNLKKKKENDASVKIIVLINENIQFNITVCLTSQGFI